MKYIKYITSVFEIQNTKYFYRASKIQNTKYIECISNTYFKYLYFKYYTTLFVRHNANEWCNISIE